MNKNDSTKIDIKNINSVSKEDLEKYYFDPNSGYSGASSLGGRKMWISMGKDDLLFDALTLGHEIAHFKFAYHQNGASGYFDYESEYKFGSKESQQVVYDHEMNSFKTEYKIYNSMVNNYTKLNNMEPIKILLEHQLGNMPDNNYQHFINVMKKDNLPAYISNKYDINLDIVSPVC